MFVVPAKAGTHGAARPPRLEFVSPPMRSGPRRCGGTLDPGLRRDDNLGCGLDSKLSGQLRYNFDRRCGEPWVSRLAFSKSSAAIVPMKRRRFAVAVGG